MASTSVLERIELSEEVAPLFRCEVVWARALDGFITEECGKEAKYLATVHANANSLVKPCVTATKYICGLCLAKIAVQWCDRHSTTILLGYTSL